MLDPQQSHAHHYVPRWYQKRFLKQGQTNFFLLDLNPEEIDIPGGKHRRRDVLYPRGPNVCFYKDDLYALKFGGRTTDEMEKKFFGVIDASGCEAVAHFAEYSGFDKDTPEMFPTLVTYMGAQRFRTPRGLDEIDARLIRRGLDPNDSNTTLISLHNMFQAYTTMWGEGVWEIVRARQSPTKFIVTDNPVTFYCKLVFQSEWKYPNDSELRYTGTRTIFPLSLDSCLIITHLQLARDPWNTPTEPRANARYYDQGALKHLGDLQFGRELEEDEVLRINYILKRRATRYVAAAERDWLFPERRVSTIEWKNLDDDWFLFPHLWKVPFTTGIMMGMKDGTYWGSDEYGRRPGNPFYEDRHLRERERITSELGRQEWARRRRGKSVAHVQGHSFRDDEIDDELMHEFLEEDRQAEGVRIHQ